MTSQIDEQPIEDTRSDLHRGEARAGNPVKGLLLAVGMAALWYTNGGRPPLAEIGGWAIYGLTSLIFFVIFVVSKHGVPDGKPSCSTCRIFSERDKWYCSDTTNQPKVFT